MSKSEDDRDSPPLSPKDVLLSQADVLEEEFSELSPKQPLPVYECEEGATEQERLEARLKTIYKSIHDLPQKRSALCLSGGGIRSATFCLGVLQGLARSGLLGKFDYLSTVSGGGYIGSWLTAWMKRVGPQKVLNALRDKPTSKINPEPKEINHLRSYSNYLSPRVGVFSVDTWTLVAIYLRNLFLNWLVFIPLLLAVLMIPRFYVWAIRQSPGIAASLAFLITGVGLGSFALAYIASNRPSLRGVRKEPNDRENNTSNFMRWCMIPLILSVILMTVGRAWYLNLEGAWYGRLVVFVAFGTALHFFAWVLYKHHLSTWISKLSELFVVLITGALGGAFLWLLLIPAKALKVYSSQPSQSPGIFACFDGPLLMVVFLLMGILSIGIGSNSIDDEDREWWARAGAWVLLAIVGWTTLNSLVIYGPLVLRKWNDLSTVPDKLKGLVVFLGFISGLITILFGLSSKTPATVKKMEKAGRLTPVMDYAVKLAAPLFALVLVMALSLLTDVLINLIRYLPQKGEGKLGELGRIYHLPLSLWSPFPDLDHLTIIRDTPFWLLAILFAAMLGIGAFMAWRININEFSLHSMYRNRLIRAYLGASTPEPDSQPFTGFDHNDDLEMSELWPKKKTGHATAALKRPMHILNMTWNLVGGKDLARQNRKAVSFTVSPLHCGSAQHGYRRSDTYGRGTKNLSLGTALTVSGAAASPNMGYHSSPATTFLMTLFNARLGWWLGNPKHNKYFRRAGPRLSVAPMFEEAFGRTDDKKGYIYLSDGGHFENLGLYEMVLRRCHYIFVVDASRDPDYKFENLGNAIRMIRVDLGVAIEIGNIFMYPRKVNKPNAYCALGQILYSGVGEGSDGLLVYIKPAIAGGEPTDVLNYAHDRDFPHESTSDQWFSEQQFESYRMLGLHAIEQIFPKESWTEEKDFKDLKVHIEELLKAYKLRV
jgi:hypothetical protein